MMTEKQLNEAIDRYVTKEPDCYDGDCNDDTHEVCDDCGYCIECEDCVTYGCQDSGAHEEMNEDKMFDVITSYMKEKDAKEDKEDETIRS